MTNGLFLTYVFNAGKNGINYVVVVPELSYFRELHNLIAMYCTRSYRKAHSVPYNIGVSKKVSKSASRGGCRDIFCAGLRLVERSV